MKVRLTLTGVATSFRAYVAHQVRPSTRELYSDAEAHMREVFAGVDGYLDLAALPPVRVTAYSCRRKT